MINNTVSAEKKETREALLIKVYETSKDECDLYHIM